MKNKNENFDLPMPTMRFPAVAVREPMSAAEAFAIVKANHAVDDDLTEADFFFWRAVISNSRLDSYYTRMAENSLRRYAKDATDGVSFQDSHKTFVLPIGRSFNGIFEAEGNPAEEFPRVIADFYTVRGLKLGDVSTDDFIKGVKVGIAKDVSIGFKEAEGFQYTCSICGLDLFDYDCRHIPGVEYDVSENAQEDPSNNDGNARALCFAWVENAALSEVSAVYDGATPSAMIVKATREMRAGRMRSDVAQFLERRFRINLRADDKSTVRGFNNQQEKESEEMSVKTNQNNNNADEQNREEGQTGQPPIFDSIEVRNVALRLGLAGVDANTSLPDALRKLEAEVVSLRKDAEIGREAKSALIEETIVEEVRAFGNDVNKEDSRATLNVLSMSQIRNMRDKFKRIADAEFPKGRQSQDANETKPEGEEKPEGEGNNEEPDVNKTEESPEARSMPVAAFVGGI